MTRVAIELLIVFGLLLTNGVLAMSEMAVVAARQARLQQRAAEGDAGAAAALQLKREPTRFLSTVQIGITLVGILAGAFGGATLAEKLDDALVDAGVGEGAAGPLSVGIVVAGITYFSLIIGELVPKRFALQHADGIASFMAGPMGVVSRVTAPLVWVLSVSTDAVLRLLRVQNSTEPEVTEDEIRLLLRAGAEAGVVHGAEHELLSGVFRLGDLAADEIMTPRTFMVWLDADDSTEETWRRMAGSPHTWFPVGRGSPEDTLGVVSVKDVWARLAATGERPPLEEVVKPALFVPGATPALSLLDSFRSTAVPIALVVDEFGGIEGLVTLTDILEAIVGDLPGTPSEPDSIVERDDGSYLLDGMLHIHELNERFSGLALPVDDDFHTLGGFIVARVGRIPAVGEKVFSPGWSFEVMDMDGRRVDRVLARRVDGDDAEPTR